MKPGSGLWITWLVGTIGSFAVLETLALRIKKFPPLSYVLRYLLGINPKTGYGYVLLVGFAGFWSWLVIHIAVGAVEELSVDTQARRSVDS